MSFLGAAWFAERAVLRGQWGLVRLAIPAAVAVLGLVIDDAYAHPRLRSGWKLARGPLLGIVFALASEEMLHLSSSSFALPRGIALYGCATGLLLSSAVCLSFPPLAHSDHVRRAPNAAGKERSVLMNTKAKIALVCAILICVAASLWIRPARQTSLTTYSYSQFLDQVRQDRVESVIVSGTDSGPADATVRFEDGSAARTVLPPDYKDALRMMQSKLVNVEIRGSVSEPHRMLMNSTPFLLLLGVWVVLMLRKPASIIR
jgi:hypothetical protein